MTIKFDVTDGIEQALRDHGPDLDRAAKETVLVELYREGKLFHSEIAQALDLSRYEVDGLLKRHGVYLDLTADELDADITGLRQAAQS